MSLSAYLAKKYLTSSTVSDPTRPKKRRKKDPSAQSAFTITDDNDDLSLAASTSVRGAEDDDAPVYDTGVRSAEFRKSKKNNWKAVGAGGGTGPTTSTAAADTDAQAEADEVLALAAREQVSRVRDAEGEDAPAVVVPSTEDAAPRMSSGAKAGLQTAADTAAIVAAEEREAVAVKKRRGGKRQEPEEETIYRDAAGRRIDISMKRAEVRAAEEERRRAEKKEREDAMGAVQLRQREERKKELDEAKFLTVARGADDEDMNEELKAQSRWGDPMAGYMAEKRAEEGVGPERDGGMTTTTTTTTKRRVYAGAAPPNRYGIPPGWRWDGVDRGNGFEKEWFQARRRHERNKGLEYQWQMDE